MGAARTRGPRNGRVFGSYRVLRWLASGGSAAVFAARDLRDGAPVALKVFHGRGRAVRRAFEREARYTARASHPNVLPLRSAEVVAGRPVLVTPLGRECLADRLERRLARRRVLAYAEQFLEALAQVHARGLVHRDLKPENLVLFRGDRLCVADFGSARPAGRALHGSVTGTPGYLAPEQALGRPGFRSDVFSAGLVLYRLMGGALPEWPFDWPFPGSQRVLATYPRALVALVRRSVSVLDRERPSDAGALLDEFLRVSKPGT